MMCDLSIMVCMELSASTIKNKASKYDSDSTIYYAGKYKYKYKYNVLVPSTLY